MRKIENITDTQNHLNVLPRVLVPSISTTLCAGKRGMTLIELMVALSVFVMVMMALSAGVIGLYRSTSASTNSVLAISSARSMEKSFVRDLRQATYSDAGAFPIATMGTSTISFYANTNSDASAEKITYTLSTTTLTKNVVTASGNPAVYTGAAAVYAESDTVVNNMRGVPVFRYFDANGNEVTDAVAREQVRAVTITLIENAATTTAPDVHVETKAVLRNLITP